MKPFVIHGLLRLGALGLISWCGTIAYAQQMSPTISEFNKKARGTVVARNVSDTPRLVSCSAQGFDVDEHGAAHPHAVDPALNVRISTGRFELGPNASRQISFDATPGLAPAWFLVTCRFVPVQRGAGLTVVMEISSIVIIYGNQLDPGDVDVSARRAGDMVEVEVENHGAGLARVDSGAILGHRKQAEVGTFILYPHQKRLVDADWKETIAPESVRIQIGKKRLETPVR